jgi:hypothetical protein
MRSLGLCLLGLIALSSAPLSLWWLPNHSAHEARYREVGRRLRPFAGGDRWLQYHDVGALVYEAEWNTIDVVGLNTRRADIVSPCVKRPDVVLPMSLERPTAELPRNPCPGIYSKIADLPFSKTPNFDRNMRVFARTDVSYLPELTGALLESWPSQHVRRGDLTWRVWILLNQLFFQTP